MNVKVVLFTRTQSVKSLTSDSNLRSRHEKSSGIKQVGLESIPRGSLKPTAVMR